MNIIMNLIMILSVVDKVIVFLCNDCVLILVVVIYVLGFRVMCKM